MDVDQPLSFSGFSLVLGNPAIMWPLCFMNHDRIPEWNYDTHVGRVWSHNDPRVGDRGKKSYDCVVKYDPRYDYHYAHSLKPEVKLPHSLHLFSGHLELQCTEGY